MLNVWSQRLLSSYRREGLAAELLRGSVGVGGLQIVSLALSFAASILLARALGPESYGQYVFVLAVVTLLGLPVTTGLGQLVTREVAKYQHSELWGLFRGLLRRAHQWVIGGAVVIGGATAALAAVNADWAADDRWTLLIIATLLLPLRGLRDLRMATLRGLRYVVFAQLPEFLVRPGLHFALAAILLLGHWLNAATALASQILATAVAFGFCAWYLSKRKPAELKRIAPSFEDGAWARALVPFTLLAAAGALNGQIGILMLGWLGSNADVAALQIAMSGAMLVATSLTIVNHVLAPHVTRAHRAVDTWRLQQLSRQSARAATVVALPIALPLIFFGGPLVELVYGNTYVAAVTVPLAILGLGQLVNVAFGSVGLFLTMSGFERDTLFGQVLALVVSAVAAFALIPLMGVVGAALAVAIGSTTWNAVLAVRLIQRLGIRPTAF
jgi:O-antigen/teichoic acid export membrane protein